MGYSGTLPNQPNTREIPRDEWEVFLSEFTREYRGTHARIEVRDPGVGYHVLTENRPFDGVSADLKDGEDVVWISVGTTPANQIMHSIHGATHIRTLPPTETAGPVMEIEAQQGAWTLLELSKTGSYDLAEASWPPSQ